MEFTITVIVTVMDHNYVMKYLTDALVMRTSKNHFIGFIQACKTLVSMTDSCSLNLFTTFYIFFLIGSCLVTE